MSESDWNSCDDPIMMLEFLQTSGKATERKLRLFAVACCRRIGSYIDDEQSWQAIEAAERYADGLADEEERQRAYETALVAASWPGYDLDGAMSAAAYTAGRSQEVIQSPLVVLQVAAFDIYGH